MRRRPTRPFAPRPVPFPAELSDADGGEGRATLFAWGRERYLILQIAAFAVLSLIIHGAGFYLFRVAYPPPVLYDAEPDAIAIIDRADPASREILREIRDRAVYLHPPSAELLGATGLPRPEDFEIRFVPALPEIEAGIRDAVYPWSLPPAIDVSPANPPRDSGAPAGDLVLGGGLESLSLAPWSILGEYLRRADGMPRLRLELTAQPSGEVQVGSVAPQLEPADRDALAGLVEGTLRFLPTDSATTGWIEIGGDSPAPQP
jgi:hypothetical protein